MKEEVEIGEYEFLDGINASVEIDVSNCWKFGFHPTDFASCQCQK